MSWQVPHLGWLHGAVPLLWDPCANCWTFTSFFLNEAPVRLTYENKDFFGWLLSLRSEPFDNDDSVLDTEIDKLLEAERVPSRSLTTRRMSRSLSNVDITRMDLSGDLEGDCGTSNELLESLWDLILRSIRLTLAVMLLTSFWCAPGTCSCETR